ncbi:hypothetical protein GCM10010177_37480 [Actinomadura citrea]|nr:hypothetical protein GCM10010177_37480 [Actinomadura citrea]
MDAQAETLPGKGCQSVGPPLRHIGRRRAGRASGLELVQAEYQFPLEVRVGADPDARQILHCEMYR